MRHPTASRILSTTWRLGLLLALGLALGGTDVARAQGGPGGGPGGGDGRLEEELRRTDEGLVRAEEIVRESESRRAREVLDGAFAIQEQAWSGYRNGNRVLSARLTRDARLAGARAVTLARQDGQLAERARREGERAMDMLRRAREEFGPDLAGAAARLLEEAAAQIERGTNQFREQHFEAALRLAVSAQRLVRQAVGDGSGGAALASRVQRELDRTDRLLEVARPIVRESGDLPARTMLERAVGLQVEARDSYREGRPRVAQAGTREARAMLNRALAIVRGPVDADAVARQLADTDALLDRVAEIVRESGDDVAASLLENARKHQERARERLEAGEPREALAQTRVARRLATRAAARAEAGDPR